MSPNHAIKIISYYLRGVSSGLRGDKAPYSQLFNKLSFLSRVNSLESDCLVIKYIWYYSRGSTENSRGKRIAYIRII